VVRELLTADLWEDIARQKEILAGIERFKAAFPKITDDDTAGKATDLASSKGLAGLWLKGIEARRVQEKTPYDRAAAAAHAVFRELMLPVEAGVSDIRALTSAYMRDKEDQQRKTERDGRAHTDTRVQGQMGAQSHLTRRWAFSAEKSDLLELVIAVSEGRAPLEYLQFNAVRIGQAVRSERLRQCPGLHIEEIRNAV